MLAIQKLRKQNSNSMIHLEPAEVLSVLRAAKASGARQWAMIVVAYKHGMRASEVCNLRLDDVDLKNGSIVVERLKGSLRTTQAVTEHRGEPLLNELKALREWLRHAGMTGPTISSPVKRAEGLIALNSSDCLGRLPAKQAWRQKSNIPTS
jgi:integrase